MRKEEYINSNKVLRKAFTNLNRDDLLFLQWLWEWSIDRNDPRNEIRFKQVVLHMCRWLNLRECNQLRKSFKILMSLKWSDE